jgi:hypothetical protein
MANKGSDTSHVIIIKSNVDTLSIVICLKEARE